MDERRMLERLQNERREPPGGYHQRVEKSLERVMATAPARRPRRPLRLAVALLLLLSLGALAVTQSGLFSFRVSYLREGWYFTLPGAERLTHRLEAVRRFPGWRAELRELRYDGRWLQLLYAIIDESAKEPFTKQQKHDIEHGALNRHQELYGQAAAYPSTETNGSLLIDGRQVNIHSQHATAGGAPGEYLFVVDSELELSARPAGGLPQLRLEGTHTLALPFTDAQGVQVAELSARFDAGDAATRYALRLPDAAAFEGGELRFHDLFASPVTLVLDYSYLESAPPPGQAEARLPALQPVDAQGQPLGTLRDAWQHSVITADGQMETRFRQSYTPPEKDGALRLKLPDGRVVELPQP